MRKLCLVAGTWALSGAVCLFTVAGYAYGQIPVTSTTADSTPGGYKGCTNGGNGNTACAYSDPSQGDYTCKGASGTTCDTGCTCKYGQPETGNYCGCTK